MKVMFGRDKKVQEFTVSTKTVLRVIALVVLAGAALRVLENMVHPLTLIFVSFFLALALNPAVTKVANRLKSRSRVLATAIAYIAVISFLTVFFSLVLPPLIQQTANFIGDIPQTLRELQDSEGFVGEMVRRYELESQVSQLANNWSSDIGSVSDGAVNIANRVISNLVSIITVLVLTFMMLVEGPRWLKAFWKQYPEDKREHAKTIAGRMYNVVTGYVVGQVLVAAIGASFAIVALIIATAVLDVSTINPVALGGIIFLFSLVPTVGTILGASIVILFSLFASPVLAITMLIYFIVYQQIENVSIQPYIQSKANELTPMIVFIAAILGIGFGGVLGAFIAIPIAGCLKVLVDDYLSRRDGKNSPTEKNKLKTNKA